MGTIRNGGHARREEQELWRRFGKERDQVARAELVDIYMPMARRMAGRYVGVSDHDDLVQVASVGLLNAIDRFDPDRGTPFAGFAKPTIMGELKRYFRDKAWAVRVPRAVHDLLGKVEKATDDLTLELGRPPSVGELASALGVDPDEVLEVLEAKRNRSPLSTDSTPPGEDEDRAAAEWLGKVDGGYELIEDRLALESVLPYLDGREREVLRLRFVEDLPQSKIAARVGCSQMHISRLLRGTLERLRREAERFPEGMRRPGEGAEGHAAAGGRR